VSGRQAARTSTQTGGGVPRSLVALFMPRHEETDRNTYRTDSYTKSNCTTVLELSPYWKSATGKDSLTASRLHTDCMRTANRLQAGRKAQEQRGLASMAGPHLMHSSSVLTAGTLNSRTSDMDSCNPDLSVMTYVDHGCCNSAHVALSFPEI
jgi:hypothetical protein